MERAMEKREKRGEPTRRAFIASALLGVGGLGVAGLGACAPQASLGETGASHESPAWDESYDVVVVGAGGAGLAAAVEARAGGVSVAVIEAMGSQNMSGTGLCGGVVYAWGTSVQKEMGIEEPSSEELMKYLDAVSDGEADDDLLHLWAEKSRDTFEWLQGQGVNFPSDLLYYSGQEKTYEDIATPAMRGHRAEGSTGATITQQLYDNACDSGVAFLFNTRVVGLHRGDSGRIVGVSCEDGGNIEAKKAVVLATAGFSRNEEMVKGFMPSLSKGGSFGSPHQQGDGIACAAQVGAKLGYVWAPAAQATALNTPNGYAYFAVGTRGLPLVLLNQQGERCLDEGMYYENLYEEIADMPGGFLWGIWDQTAPDSGNPANIAIPSLSEGAEKEIEAGLVYKADSLEDIARQLDIDPTVLSATVSRFNGFAEEGSDLDFGRTKGLVPLNNPPYYAAKIVPAVCDTGGGIRIDLEAHVIDWNDEPIPGLYAAGTTVGGWRGKRYPGSGSAVTWAVFSGRVAGQNAAAEEV